MEDDSTVPASMTHFLLVYDTKAGQLLREPVEFEDSDESRAAEEYGKTEEEFEDRADIQVVLLSADSLDTLRVTHANFFTELTFEGVLDR